MPTPARLFVALAFVVAAAAQSPDNSVCAGCHEQEIKKVAGTAHQAATCASCHPKHEEYPHPPNVPKAACSSCHASESTAMDRGVHGQAARAGNAAAPDCAACHGSAHEVQLTSSAAFRKGVPETCGMCHDKVAAEFTSSVHGQALARGSLATAVCSDCHGEHDIERPKSAGSRVNSLRIANTCGQCHGQVTVTGEFRPRLDRVKTFEESFHGLALRSGVTSVANCASCHGVHNILPASDSRSAVHAANLNATCGKCHPGAGQRFALGPVHIAADLAEPMPVRIARQIYTVLIPLILGLMAIHNAGDWVRKLHALRLSGTPRPVAIDVSGAVIRMHRFERYQHAFLVVSFTVLTWSGFALIYPDQWWARPLLIWENRWPVRGIVHRVASVVFMLVAVVHAISLVRSPRLRKHWLHLLPRWSDLREAFEMFAYNLGLRRERPQLTPHSYIEKAEYWAVVWGAVIMVLTGLLLWANRWALAYLPKTVLDLATTIHFYEAVLAALAIVIWHLYFVIVDPDVYPMDTAWLTGKSTRLRKRTDDHDTTDVEA